MAGVAVNPSLSGVSPREVAESYWAAECTRDSDAILAHYHSDATFWVAGQELSGHDQIRTFYDSSGAQYPGLTVEIRNEVSDGNKACLEWRAVLTSPNGAEVELLGTNVIEVEDGRFRRVRAYFDPTVFE